MVKEAGCATGLAGKWHLGYDDQFAPGRHGFEHAFYALGGGMDYFHHVEFDEAGRPAPMLRLNGRPIERQGYFTDLVTDEAVRFIRAQAGKPFFLYVAYTAPHAPFQGPDEFRPEPLPRDSQRYDQGRGPRTVYRAMVERMDHGVGRIVQTLADLRLAENTVVIFTSDNGGTKSGRNAPLSGNKGSTFEGGIRVPAVIRWPTRIPNGAVRACESM